MVVTYYLIIGSGVAGLTFAIKIADRFPDKKVTLKLTQTNLTLNMRKAVLPLSLIKMRIRTKNILKTH